ncbi:homolog of E. coli HemX protein [Halorhodospira halochloris]|uniref:Homolog of E. coli HemX protein n=1 Tax=Halorhodospira halochloris TaxID=1052 RepID=A0A110B4B1_HALHR|nr:homolog of E. coli HemX protein [Halorhodospira halochloris]
MWLFILALTGAVGGMGYYGYQEFYLQEFTELRDQVDQLDPDTLADELATRQEEVAADWEERADEVEQQLDRAEEQADKLSELEDKLLELEESLADLEGLDELREIRDELDTDLLERIEQGLADVEDLEQLEGIDDRLSDLEGRLAQLEELDGVDELVDEQLGGIDERISSVEEQLSGFEEKLDELDSRLTDMDSVKERSEETADKLADLESRLDELAEQAEDTEAAEKKAEELISELEERFSGRLDELTEKVERLDTLSPEDEESWIRAEAAHLVQIAQQRVRYHKDVQSALEALKSADSLYAQLGGAAVDEREAIGEAIDQLLDYSAPDLKGLRDRITAQMGAIEAMALRSENGPIVDGEVPELDDEAAEEGWDRAVARLREGLGSLIRVEREDEIRQYIPAEQRFFIRENLRMQLEGAILALNRADEEMFQDNIERAKGWLERYFDDDDDAVIEAQQELEDIVEESIQLDPPDIQSVLDPVKSF